MPDPDFGRITDAKVQKLRDRIGVELDPSNFEGPTDVSGWRPVSTGYNHEVTPDGVRHFVHGYGDDNPLFCDPVYGAQSSWGTLIAPPTFVWSMYLPPRDNEITYGGGDEPTRQLRSDVREELRGDPLRGLGALQSRLEYEFYRPLRPGDQLFVKRSMIGVKEKQSSWGGRAVHVTWGLVSWNQHRELIHLQRGTWIRAERRPVVEGKAGGTKEVQPVAEPYSPDDLAEIDAAYDAESRRGGERLYFEDVELGDELPTLVKGPLRLTDVILWHAGFGQAFPTYAFRRSYEMRKRSPGLYTPNEYNVPDIVQRMHWDADWARKVGAAERYDYGALRETWLCQLISDWAGDESWLVTLEAEHRKFNYIGDTTWVKGRVTGKSERSGSPIVSLEIWCENQRGEVTSPATAEVVLPSRARALRLTPPVNDDPLDLLRNEIARLAGEPED